MSNSSPLSWIKQMWNAVLLRPNNLVDHVQKLDQQNREVRHDLKNIQASADALKHLVMGMRGEGYRQEQREKDHR